ncbi:cysteine proteinase inhibitor 1-like [Momordica charantia]|uniref:Cysteine proteinase inhibitor 1-like n=1 Tax=Momordica charantia TaxID=3673 RepID=A0A6J1DTA4_MOMCH|nr:cysteine proteinase inhibitor 1-like [Momordica charantia]
MVAAAAAVEPPSHAKGAYEPIKDVNASFIQEIGRYACIEYNRINEKKPEFTPHVYQKVVKGEQQVVGGMNYRLALMVTVNKQSQYYQAIVYDRSWESHRELTSFRRLLQN